MWATDFNFYPPVVASLSKWLQVVMPWLIHYRTDVLLDSLGCESRAPIHH